MLSTHGFVTCSIAEIVDPALSFQYAGAFLIDNEPDETFIIRNQRYGVPVTSFAPCHGKNRE